MKKTVLSIFLPVLLLGAASLSSAADTAIQITDIKMAQGIDEKYMPLEPSKNFPDGTAKVFCWFEWKGAQANESLTAKWTYVTENIPILECPLPIPRKQGSGGIALSMPQGKTLPAGLYEVELLFDKKILKSLKFEIRAKK